jgi:hypothetical protein
MLFGFRFLESKKTLALQRDLSMSKDICGIRCGQTWGLQGTCFNIFLWRKLEFNGDFMGMYGDS